MVSPLEPTRRTVRLLLALLIALAGVAAATGGLFRPAEDALLSARASAFNRAPTNDVVVVEIDARSISELESWPWPRRFHAELVNELNRADASTIAFDVDFSARSHDGDAAFARAIQDSKHVILPIFQQRSSELNNRHLIISRPHPAFSAAWVGGVNIFPDNDGVVRTYPGATMIGNTIQPSIAALAAETSGIGARSFQPDWSIDAALIPRHSFVDVLRGRVPHDQLRGKTILVGATAIELGDRYVIPRYGVVPGVLIQALALETLLQGRALQQFGPLAVIAGIFIIAAILRPRRRFRTAKLVPLYGVMLAVVIGLPILADSRFQLAIESAPWLFTIVAAAAVQGIVEARQRLKLKTFVDPDTGLPNRAALEQELQRVHGRSRTIAAASIDRFEIIRDAFGLAGASELLGMSASVLRSNVGAEVYRISSDILAWIVDPEDDVELLCDRLDHAFRTPVQTQCGPADVKLAFGLASGKNAFNPTQQIEHALAAVTEARATGRAIHWYEGSKPQIRRELSMASDLRLAMDEDRLSLVYQPKLSLASGRFTGAEALIRWVDASGASVSPEAFIPFAEATGFIREITAFALRAACSDLARSLAGAADFRVSVNVSASDLCEPSFADEVAGILQNTGVSPSRLTLEITESAFMRSQDVAIENLNALRGHGIRLSVDDYGTGQSSLTYLKCMPVQELKIDKSFVTHMCSRPNDAIMVRSTIELAHELGMEVVAEGIETQETLKLLQEIHCDIVQGYLISRPVRIESLVSMLDTDPPVALVA